MIKFTSMLYEVYNYCSDFLTSLPSILSALGAFLISVGFLRTFFFRD